MSASDARTALPHGLLDRLGRRTEADAADPALLAADIALLKETGYLKLALPAGWGGAGLNLGQVACAQRQLAALAPAAALAVNAQHAWVGAAADALASGDSSACWVLTQAARGRVFAGRGRTGYALPGGGPAGPPRVLPDVLPDVLPAGPPGARGDTFLAGMFGWALPLDGMTWYAIARHAFTRATGRDDRRTGARPTDGATNSATDGATDGGAAESGDPLGQWPAAEAALRLDGMRGQLDEVIDGWQQRVAAGGALTSLDPGGQWLIRLFTVRHAATDSARRVLELAAQIGGEIAARPGGVPGRA